MKASINTTNKISEQLKVEKSKGFHSYDVAGNSQTRNGINFIENGYTAQVQYSEDFSDPFNLKVIYNVNNLEQSCDGIIFQFAKRFNEFTSDLVLKVNEINEVEEIINHHEIIQKWNDGKSELKLQFQQIPNIQELLENYEKSIGSEEKLRNSIFYVGISQLFFPRIKQLFTPPIEATKFARTRLLHGFYFGIQIPIKEELSVKEIRDNKLVANITGELDVENIVDKEKFLSAFRLLYGENVELDDISFQATERYVLSEDLVNLKGEINQHFEIKGVHFKKDNLSYTIIGDE